MQKGYGYDSNAHNSTAESPRKWVPSSFSKDEKRAIRKRLKKELQHLQSISSRLAARINEVKRISSSNDNRIPMISGSYPDADLGTQTKMPRQLSAQASDSQTPSFQGKEKRTPKANSAYINNDFLSGRDKFPPAEKPKSKAMGVKRGVQGRTLDSREMKRQRIEAMQSKRMSELLKQCGTILKKLSLHKFYWVFSEPVDIVKLEIFDYHSIVKKPMDLGTVGKKLRSGQYPHPSYFADDCRLVFSNAILYNGTGHQVSLMAEELRKIFEAGYAKIEEKLDEEAERIKQEEELLHAEFQQDVQIGENYKGASQRVEPRGQGEGVPGSAPAKFRPPRTIPKSASVSSAKGKAQDFKRQMSFEEKRKLSVNLGKLPGDRLGTIVQIISERNPHLSQNEDEIELDIDNLDNETLWELERYVANCMKNKGKSKRKMEEEAPAEVIPAQGAGQEASPGNVYNGEVDDEVDIGDDDMPSSSVVPVVIEKDQKENTTKSSSSSSSSSEESGSSSSDSDSGSSSASEATENRRNKPLPIPAAEAPNPTRGNVQSGAAKDENVQKEKEITERNNNAVIAEESVASEERNAEKKGEKSSEKRTEEPSEKAKVMTEAEVRAALLRGKYADSILNAQKKKLEKTDPKKALELEKKQKEERARLEAEAQAADALRKKKEQEYQMELKRKREEEREAARKALHEMERTVEIGDNAEILKDLHLLSTNVGATKHLQSSHAASHLSPSRHQMDGDQNPLEMFGLFRKEDDDASEDENMDGAENGDGDEDDEPMSQNDGENDEVYDENDVDYAHDDDRNNGLYDTNGPSNGDGDDDRDGDDDVGNYNINSVRERGDKNRDEMKGRKVYDGEDCDVDCDGDEDDVDDNPTNNLERNGNNPEYDDNERRDNDDDVDVAPSKDKGRMQQRMRIEVSGDNVEDDNDGGGGGGDDDDDAMDGKDSIARNENNENLNDINRDVNFEQCGKDCDYKKRKNGMDMNNNNGVGDDGDNDKNVGAGDGDGDGDVDGGGDEDDIKDGNDIVN